MQQLFGTDGIRGRAGEFPLDRQTVSVIGASLARHMCERLGRAPKIISGRDTRVSGEWIEAAFEAGALSESAECESAGVITTPGVAYLTARFDFDAGVVISASHNPFHDNGIKIFAPSGKKMDEATERLIEEDIARHSFASVSGGDLHTARVEEFAAAYLEHLRTTAGIKLTSPLRIVIDCANGAASKLAPQLFRSIGADVVAIHDEPDGENINQDCGSLHLEGLRSAVLREKADLGIAFDGDADRALFVDETGEIVDGDATLWVMAQHLRAGGGLRNSTVVATVMSNIGLEIALSSIGVKLLRANVGDKYVLEKLIESGSEIGGEQSGHIIFPEIGLAGDGMMTALELIKALTMGGRRLSEAVRGFTRYPQILLNVPVREKRPFASVPEIESAASAIQTELNSDGRLLLRYSGTENLARVMIEGKEQRTIEQQAERLADVIRASLG